MLETDNTKPLLKVISDVGHQDVKILVAGNGPVNFNMYVMLREAPNLQPNNILGLSRVSERRAKSLVANKLQVSDKRTEGK